MSTLNAFRSALLTLALALGLSSCSSGPSPSSVPSTAGAVVGPPRGAVLVVGGGSMGPELYAKFIELAGGPNALIVDVPTAGGAATYAPDWQGARGFKNAGAKNVVILHTTDKKIADSDAFVEPLKRAGAVWFEGGRQWHLVDSYAGTKTERAFMEVLERGGIVGGSSAGASILGSYLLRGAREGNTVIMAPGYEVGFGYLRGVAIDQHVVARERLRDLADSLMPRHPELLGISEDEGTAWLVRGDVAEIMGRSKAFVYGGRDATDAGRPFLTLRPGDRYNLAARRVTHRATDDSPLSAAFIDSLFAPFSRAGGPGATVLVAQDGRVLANKAFGLPDPANNRYMPATTVPNFALGSMSTIFSASPALSAQRDTGSLSARMGRRLFTPLGMHKTTGAEDAQVSSNVDELYRWDQGLYSNRGLSADTTAKPPATDARGTSAPPAAPGFRADVYRGLPRLIATGAPDGRRHAFVRIPGHRVAVIVLTADAGANAQQLADRIVDRLLFTRGDSRWSARPVATTSSCRSLSAVTELIAWVGCSGGKVLHTSDGGTTWTVDSVAGAARLDFRGIKAFDTKSAVVTSAGAAEQGAARIYRTADGGKSWALAWSDSTKGIFLDGVAFWDRQNGFTFSDPVDGRLVILTTGDGGASWSKVPPAGIPPVIPGEAAFAASNTQLTVAGSSHGWIATGGGAEARVFRTTDRGRSWSVASTGMPGGASAGLFGIAFADERNGVAVGGDYRIERGITDFAIRTRDGGVTWSPAGYLRPDGTTQGLTVVRGSTPLFVAAGAHGTALSRDFGATWTQGDTLTSWALDFANANTGWVAGPRGRVAKFSAAPK